MRNPRVQALREGHIKLSQYLSEYLACEFDVLDVTFVLDHVAQLEARVTSLTRSVDQLIAKKAIDHGEQ
jgi:hypothetical protein